MSAYAEADRARDELQYQPVERDQAANYPTTSVEELTLVANRRLQGASAKAGRLRYACTCRCATESGRFPRREAVIGRLMDCCTSSYCTVLYCSTVVRAPQIRESVCATQLGIHTALQSLFLGGWGTNEDPGPRPPNQPTLVLPHRGRSVHVRWRQLLS
ncbi:hypothetical protein CALCODRAFT_198672 [Calocera cornea HHB12733]|uniref:Uncharacterized protein n=1 Tax=Calocera cornea HHB12733 TaxID=1353952 RepID=A0A165HFW7_9BASI|nr:hypothetical protein CALCODRAFT_198672 [Calocera cornea HHB12733]